MRIIHVKRRLKIGDEVVIFSPTASKGEPVKFCEMSETWGLRPLAMGECAGKIPPLQTLSRNGKKADVNRFYKRFVVKSL